MKDRSRRRFLHALTGIALASALSSAWADALTGEVVGLADGDTLTVLTSDRQQVKVRLAGIDAPEKSQSFGTQARQALSAMAFRQKVSITWQKQDRYGRIVGVVMVGRLDVGLELIRLGLAWHYKQYEAEQTPRDRSAYAAAELQARAGHIGLWQDKAPMAPWNFRNSKKKR